MKKIKIILPFFLSLSILTGCVTQPTNRVSYQTPIYFNSNDMLSQRVDYVGYGLGGQGLGGYGMGGYGLSGYAGDWREL